MDCAEYANAFETGYPSTCRSLRVRGARTEEAEEFAQAAWARGWEFREQLRDPAGVGCWVNSIARNLFRARFRHACLSLDEDIGAGYHMDLDALEIHRLLERCPLLERALLERRLEGYSAEEIGKSVGMTPTNVRVRLLRVRKNLKEQMRVAA